MVSIRKGSLVTEGKTKRVFRLQTHKNLVLVESKDDITAGDGAKHDELLDKAKMSTKTTCNVFAYLKAQGVPVAFHGKFAANSFLADECQMLPYEVIVRREAHGSYLKRMPHLQKGDQFDELLVEFFLKTSGRKFQDKTLPVDDPLMVMDGQDCLLYLPNKPIEEQEKPILVIMGMPIRWEEMADIATITFAMLEVAWEKQGLSLVDFKVEFGIDVNNNLLLADVIDNDSWRLTENGEYLDKQVYRDGGSLDAVAMNYRRVADATEKFLALTL